MAIAYDDKPKPLGGPMLLGVPVKHVSLATVSCLWRILPAESSAHVHDQLTRIDPRAAHVSKLDPHPPCPLLAYHDAFGRPQVLCVHRHIPHRGHQAGHILDSGNLRSVTESCALDTCDGAVRAAVQCGFLW